MNKLRILSTVLLLVGLAACGSEPAQDAAAERSNTELSHAVNKPLDKAREVESALEEAARARDESLND